MKKLDKFILKSFIGPFIAILFIVIFILMMQFLWLYIDELVGKGLSLKIILEFLGWGTITTLYLSMPLAVLLAAVMTLGTFGENNELLAIKSAGVSVGRVLLPLAIASVGISAMAFIISDRLVPIAYNKIYTLRDDIGRTKEEIKIPTGTFYNGIEGYILRVGSRDKNGTMHDVMIYNHAGSRGNVALTLADSARISISEDKSAMTFLMFNGTNYEETNKKQYKDTTLQVQRVQFEKETLIIPLANYAFEKSDSAHFENEVNSMRNSQLRVQQDTLRKAVSIRHKEQLEKLMTDPVLSYNKQLDSSHRAKIHQALDIENMGKWDSLQEEIDAYNQAVTNIDNLLSTMEGFTRDGYRDNMVLRRTDVGILKKYASALACLIMFLLGAPIGATTKKKGLGVPAIISVLFFVVYWVIDISGNRLAQNGAIGAFVGVFCSSFVLIPLGIFMIWRVVNDEPIINLEAIKNLFKKILRKIMSIRKRAKIVYMGTPEFAVAPLDNLIKEGYDVIAVVTVPDKASGRGLKVNESAVKKYAVEHHIPVYQPEKMKDPEFVEAMKALKPDLFVVVAFRMLPKIVWEIPRFGTFNLHAALLPQYRGAAPINWAIINGEKFSGVTTFMIDDGIDTGKIIFREQCAVGAEETAGELHDKLMNIGTNLVQMTVQSIFDRNIELNVQKTYIQGEEVLKPAPKLTRELCHIDWNDKSKNIFNLIRGLSPYPAAFTELEKDGKATQLKIFGASVMDAGQIGALGLDCSEAGRLFSDGKSYIAITTADGAISLNDIQLSGKKRMDVKSFLLGFRDPESYSVTSGTSKAAIKATK